MVKYTDREKEIAIEFAHDLVDCGVYDYIDNAHHYLADPVESQEYFDNRCEKRRAFYNNLKTLPYDTTVASGSTRGVFMRDDEELDNWVIKVDFTDNSCNYCKREVGFFTEAVSEGVDWAFAATYFLCEIDGIDFYIQERLDCGTEYESYSSSKIREYLIEEVGITQEDYEDEDDYECRLADYEDSWLEWDDVLACLIHDSDVEEFVYDRDINDLHSGNYGMLPNGVIKIVDYCGYME